MGNILAYSGIVTKIRAMEAKLLSPKQFEEISAMKSVPEVAAYLMEKSSYGEILDGMPPEMLHRGNIEKLLLLSLYKDYTKIYRFGSQDQRRFLRLYLKRYEVELINYCLRIVINHYSEPFDLQYKKMFFDKYSQINIDSLIHARTTDELVENLKGTEYYEPLKRLQNGRAVTLFDYDLALNLYYFTAIWKERKGILKRILSEKELEIYIKDCGVKINMLNIQWIYRAKKYFSLSSADIYALLIPVHYKISTDLVKEMVEAPSVEEFYRAFEKTSYARHYDFEKDLTIERMYADYLHYLYVTDRRRNPYSIASVNTYLFLKEEELQKLTTAIECVRYGVSPEETLEYIGGRKT